MSKETAGQSCLFCRNWGWKKRREQLKVGNAEAGERQGKEQMH